MNWHTLSEEEIFDILQTKKQTGLSYEEVHERFKKYGKNQLTEQKKVTKFQILLSQFKNPLILILLVSGGVTTYLQDFTDTFILGITIIINTIFGYVQESKTSEILRALKKAIKVKAIVRRNGEEKEILQEDLVPGDIIILKAGLKVPADARIIQSNYLKINEAVLTGEWLPVEKSSLSISKNIPLSERTNMAYMGTIIESGEGEAIVVETGNKTEIGIIAETTIKTAEEKTPYQKKLEKFSRVIGAIIVLVCILIFAQGAIRGLDLKEMFLVSVAIAVAAIPEGLPMAMTVILAIGSQKILKKKGLVRKLASAETLGSASIILMDKTGTLTEAKMKVWEIISGEKIFHTAPVLETDNLSKLQESTLKTSVMSNEAFIENFNEPIEKWIIRGRPTERALVEAGIKHGIIKKEIEEKESKIDEIIFSADYKYSAVLYKKQNEEKIIYSMGAPEIILEKISEIEIYDGTKKLNKEEIKEILKKCDTLASQGFRVLATAWKKTEKDKLEEKDISEMIFSGIISIRDPIRPEVKKALESCREAGISPIIITGDNKHTAKTIANELGMEVADENIIEGIELERMTDDELMSVLKKIKIFARVIPTQKLRIVSAWQKVGEVVAMVGDGVNDAPAIKKADIGIALGSGTDAAKEAADFVLLDDSFVVIETAIEEGRKILDNVRKVITYLLSDSFTETLLVGTAMLLNLPIPVTAAQILWVNLIEDGLPNIALAFEPKEKGIMKRKPNGHSKSLLTKEMKAIIFIIGILTDLVLIAVFVYLSKTKENLETIRTVVFSLLAINSIFYVFSCKNLRENIWKINIFSNKFLVFSSFVGMVALVSAIYIPFLNSLLGTIPLPLSYWPIIFGIAIINILFIETGKWYFIKNKMTE